MLSMQDPFIFCLTAAGTPFAQNKVTRSSRFLSKVVIAELENQMLKHITLPIIVSTLAAVTFPACVSSGSSTSQSANGEKNTELVSVGVDSTGETPVVQSNNTKLLNLEGAGGYFLAKGSVKAIVESAKAAKKNLGTQGTNLDSFKALAYEALATNNPDGAIQYLKISEERKAGLDDDALIILGVAYLVKNDEVKGFSYLQRAEAMNPRNIIPTVNMGIFYLSKARGLRSYPYFKRALDVEPRNATVHTLAASSMFAMKDFKGSTRHLEKAIKANPQSRISRFNLGLVYYIGMRDFSAASRELKVIVDDAAADPRLKARAEGMLANVKREEQGRQGISTIGVY